MNKKYMTTHTHYLFLAPFARSTFTTYLYPELSPSEAVVPLLSTALISALWLLKIVRHLFAVFADQCSGVALTVFTVNVCTLQLK
jgi:hypothetical protein